MSKIALTQIDGRIDQILGKLPSELRGELRGLQLAREAMLAELVEVSPKRAEETGNAPSLRKVVDDIMREIPDLVAKEIRAEASKRMKKEVKSRSISAILSEACKAKKYVNNFGRYRISSAA